MKEQRQLSIPSRIIVQEGKMDWLIQDPFLHRRGFFITDRRSSPDFSLSAGSRSLWSKSLFLSNRISPYIVQRCMLDSQADEGEVRINGWAGKGLVTNYEQIIPWCFRQ
jgi:hypothetical protein